VLLFSDNVSLQDEIALKAFADAHGLLLMGPGAGTAILNGVALGFANVVPQVRWGSSLLLVRVAGGQHPARRGVGITQGIGTGGRDLKEQVGGS
jgi:FdrA protein